MRALLVPGNDLCPAFYDPLVAALGRRGIEASAMPLAPHRTWDAAVGAVLAAAAEQLGGEGGGALVGHSLGGLMAFLAAARRPPEVRSLVLLEPAIVPWRRLAAAAAGRYSRDVVSGDRTRFSNWSGSRTPSSSAA